MAIQVSRLNEALLVAYSAMGAMNLKAVDQVVRIVHELDRYHGVAAAARRLPEASDCQGPVEGTAAFGATLVCSARFAPQGPAIIQFMSGFAMGTEPENSAEGAPKQEPAIAPLDDCRSPATGQAGVCHPRGSGGPAAEASVLSNLSSRLDLDARFRGHDKASPVPTFREPQCADRYQNPPQSSEKVEFAVRFSLAAEGQVCEDPTPRAKAAGPEPILIPESDQGNVFAPWDIPSTISARALRQAQDQVAGRDNRPEILLQTFEKIESGIGKGGPDDEAPVLPTTVP